jgi:AraC-like DNA-binding protein
VERAPDLERFREAPLGRFLVGASWIHFCARAELWGVSLFGRPSRDDAVQLDASIALELAPDAGPHASYVDARALEGADAGAYAVLIEHARRSYDASRRVFTRLALVVPPGFEGAAVAGFYGSLPPPCPVQVFAAPDLALRWIGESDAKLDAELAAIRAALRDTPPLLDGLHALLREQLAEPDAEAIGRALHLSQRTLQRRLQELGTSFQKEVHAARLAEAQRRLRASDDPLTVIALEVGFASPQHFSALFRRAVGESPSAWRARHRTSNPED